MTDEPVPTEWRREELRRPSRTLRLPWLALVATATVVAAATLVIGIGDTLSSRDGPSGRLLPLQAASPPVTPPPATSAPAPGPATRPPRQVPAESPEPATSVHEALLRLRYAVDEGVATGDVRDDVGIDLTNVIEGMLGQGRRPRERRRADVASLRHKIAARTREGAISGGRAEELRLILDRAAP